MKEKIIEILESLIPGVEFELETELIDDGVIDSLDLVSLVSELIGEFDVELGVEDLIPENFNSIDAIVQLVERVSL